MHEWRSPSVAVPGATGCVMTSYLCVVLYVVVVLGILTVKFLLGYNSVNNYVTFPCATMALK